MYFGIDGLPLSELRTGVGHYTFELAQALAALRPADQFELVSPRPLLPAPGDESKSETSLPANLCVTEAKTNFLTRHWWSMGLPRYIRQKGIDLFHGTNYDVPLWKFCATVLTVHDVSSFVHPQTHTRRSVLRARRRLPFMLRTANAIIAPSQSVRDEIGEHASFALHKTFVVPEAPRAIFRPRAFGQTSGARKRLGVADDFLLFVSTIEPRKNLGVLLAAYEELLRRMNPCPQLVVTGRRGWLTDELVSRLQASNLKDRVLLTGYVSDDDLCALYASCRIFVYPSLYEGFGLPPLEAMACGAPVVASRIPPLVETIEGAAELVPPGDAQSLARSITALLEDEAKRKHLSDAGRKRAAQFTWRGAAELTLEVYDEALRRWKKERGC